MVERVQPPEAGTEKETLDAFLDYQRASLLLKLEGLSEEDARKRLVPSLTTPLGIVKHLVDVEKWWFEHHFAGRECTYFSTDEDPDADFRIEEGETIEQITTLYLEACDRAREVTAGASLEQRAALKRSKRLLEHPTLRWIYLHMIEETARHAGHMDILREQIDGATGH